MNALIEHIAEAGITFLSFAWVPLLIWTALALTVLAGLRVFRNMHIQYHYHLRLGLLLALPAGFLISWFLSTLEPSAAPEGTVSPFKLIVISTPIELAESTSDGSISAFDYLKQFAIWIIAVGILLHGGRYLKQFLRLRYLARSLPMAPVNEIVLVSESTLSLARSSGRSISVAVVSDSIIPFTFGSSRPVIILPAELMNQEEKLNLVLKHEIMHIVNRDYRMHCVTAIIRSLFWYNPLVHIVYRQLVEYREIRCDNHVLSDHTISKKKYATLLMELLIPDLNHPLSVNMAHGRSNLRRRIDLMSSQSIRRLPVRAGLSLFSAVFLITALFMSFTDFQLREITGTVSTLSPGPDVDAASFGLLESTQLLQSIVSGSRNTTVSNSEFVLNPDPVIIDPQSMEIPGPDVPSNDVSNVAPDQQSLSAIQNLQEPIDIPERKLTYDPLLSSAPPSYSRFRNILENPVVDNSIVSNRSESTESPVASTANGRDYFTAVEQMPELIGGQSLLQSQLTYPDVARRAHVEGTVIVEFIVNEQGRVVQPEIINGVHAALDREALRVLELAHFHPGRQHGQAVRVRYSVPIIFKLQA